MAVAAILAAQARKQGRPDNRESFQHNARRESRRETAQMKQMMLQMTKTMERIEHSKAEAPQQARKTIFSAAAAVAAQEKALALEQNRSINRTSAVVAGRKGAQKWLEKIDKEPTFATFDQIVDENRSRKDQSDAAKPVEEAAKKVDQKNDSWLRRKLRQFYYSFMCQLAVASFIVLNFLSNAIEAQFVYSETPFIAVRRRGRGAQGWVRVGERGEGGETQVEGVQKEADVSLPAPH